MSYVTNKHFLIGIVVGVVGFWVYNSYVRGKVMQMTSGSATG